MTLATSFWSSTAENFRNFCAAMWTNTGGRRKVYYVLREEKKWGYNQYYQLIWRTITTNTRSCLQTVQREQEWNVDCWTHSHCVDTAIARRDDRPPLWTADRTPGIDRSAPLAVNHAQNALAHIAVDRRAVNPHPHCGRLRNSNSSTLKLLKTIQLLN